MIGNTTFAIDFSLELNLSFRCHFCAAFDIQSSSPDVSILMTTLAGHGSCALISIDQTTFDQIFLQSADPLSLLSPFGHGHTTQGT